MYTFIIFVAGMSQRRSLNLEQVERFRYCLNNDNTGKIDKGAMIMAETVETFVKAL